MRVYIREDAMQLHARSVPAHMGYTKAQFEYRDRLRLIKGTWVEVDTRYGVDNYFSVIMPNGTIIDIPKEFTDGIIIGMAEETIEDTDN